MRNVLGPIEEQEKTISLAYWGMVAAVGILTFLGGYMIGQNRPHPQAPPAPMANSEIDTQGKTDFAKDQAGEMGEDELDQKIKAVIAENKQKESIRYTFPEVLSNNRSKKTKVEDRAQPEKPMLIHNPKPIVQKKPTLTQSKSTKKSQAASNFAVQVGSFQDEEQAEALARRLRQKGYDVHLQSANLARRGTWFRVQVGQHRNRAQADKLARLLEKQEKLSTIVVNNK